MTQQAGDFVWFELLTNDVDASVAHYTEVLGWKPRTMDMGDFEYKMLGRNDKGHCGVVKPQQRDVPSHWSAYIAVENVDATAAKVEKAGGKVLVPPTDLPSVGRFALIADPEGATLNIFAANDRENASTGFHWTELWCHEPKKTLAFYEAVLGAKITAPTIHGDVTISIPKGSNAGRVLRLKGRGIRNPKDNSAGDQYVKLKVVLPEVPDAELEKFVRGWKQGEEHDPRAGLRSG